MADIDDFVGSVASLRDVETFRDADIPAIQHIVSRMLRETQGLCSPDEVDNLPPAELRYSSSEVATCSWQPGDYDFAWGMLQQRRREILYVNLLHRYEESNPVRDSVVRLAEEEAIFNDLDAGNSVLIRGYWRIGKTSMLQSLVHRRSLEQDTIHIDLSRVRVSTVDELERALIREVADFIAPKTEPANQPGAIISAIESGEHTAMQYLDEFLGARGESSILVLDEIFMYAKKPDLMRYLAELQQLQNLNVAIVLHRVHDQEEQNAELFTDYNTHYITALSLEEAATMVRYPLEGTGVTFTDEAIEEMWRFAGGRPMEINSMCRSLLNPYSEHVRTEYDVEDVRRVTDNWREGPFTTPQRTYEKIYQLALSPDEQGIIRRLLAEESIGFDAVEESIMQPLLDTLVVVCDDELQAYVLNGGLLKNVLRDITQ